MRKKIFFAYKRQKDGSADDNVAAIKKAVENYNSHQSGNEAKLWEDFRKSTFINKEILNIIEQFDAFVADLTFMNYNVLFEFGYASGKNKEILTLLNTKIKDSGKNFKRTILKNIRYSKFSNSKDIGKELQHWNFKDNLLSDYIKFENLQENEKDVFYIKSANPNDSSLGLTEMINDICDENKISLISDDPIQVKYRTLQWYLKNIYQSKNLIIHLLGKDVYGNELENAKNTFFAGVACGLGKDVVLFAPSIYEAPLDYHDILVQYATPEDLQESALDWLDKFVVSVKDKDLKGVGGRDVNVSVEKKERELNLIKLGIGCEFAEGEKDSLDSYFVETSSYIYARKQDRVLLTGEMGSGKTAIYVKLNEELERDKNSFLVDLKPEADELLNDIEKVVLFKSEASKKSFFISLWVFVIISKLLLVIYEKLKSDKYRETNEMELNIIAFVDKHKHLINKGVFGVIRELNKIEGDVIDAENPTALQQMYSGYLAKCIRLVKNYFRSNNFKYYQIVLLADGLDQTWDMKYGLDIQSELILTLIEMQSKLVEKLKDSKQKDIKIKKIIFLRKDIYNYIQKNASESHKISLMEHEINWNNYPSLLKLVIEKRFKHVLEVEDNIGKIWDDYFDKAFTPDAFLLVNSLTENKPRDIIYFFSRLFESAINSGRSLVMKDDYKYAIKSYTGFVTENISQEIKSSCIEIRNVLNKIYRYTGNIISHKRFLSIVKQCGFGAKDRDEMLEIMLKKQVFICVDIKTGEAIKSISEAMREMTKFRFPFIQAKTAMIYYPKIYYAVKNGMLPTDILEEVKNERTY